MDNALTDNALTNDASTDNAPVKKWRTPDAQINDTWAVWYGPSGIDGDSATEVQHSWSGEYIVSEYIDARPYIDNLDPATPFLKTSATVVADNIYTAVERGTRYLGYFGGQEEFVNALPRG